MTDIKHTEEILDTFNGNDEPIEPIERMLTALLTLAEIRSAPDGSLQAAMAAKRLPEAVYDLKVALDTYVDERVGEALARERGLN